MPPARDAQGREVGAVRGVVSSILGLINGGARYMGVATDHVIESFRNGLWPGYKTSAGIEPHAAVWEPECHSCRWRDALKSGSSTPDEAAATPRQVYSSSC